MDNTTKPHSLQTPEDHMLENGVRQYPDIEDQQPVVKGVNPEHGDSPRKDRTADEPCETVSSPDPEDPSRTAEILFAGISGIRLPQASPVWDSPLMVRILEEAPNMIARHGETVMQSAMTVFLHLQEKGLAISNTGEQLTNPTAISNALGRNGFDLPRVKQNGKLYYCLNFVDASDHEKWRTQERLDRIAAGLWGAFKTA